MHISSLTAAARLLSSRTASTHEQRWLLSICARLLPATQPMKQAGLFSRLDTPSCSSSLIKRPSFSPCSRVQVSNTCSQVRRSSRRLHSPRTSAGRSLYRFDHETCSTVRTLCSRAQQELPASATDVQVSSMETASTGDPWHQFLTALYERGYFTAEQPGPSASV
jgi:hypothetical protein